VKLQKAMDHYLAVELCFRFGASPEHWRQTLSGLLRWEPRLAPTTYERRTDLDAPGPEPWSDALWPEVARRLAVDESWTPAMAMLFDRDSDDAEFLMQGLRRLVAIPPVLYLDARAVERAGGAIRLRAVPCTVFEPSPGALLIVAQESPWSPPSPEDSDRRDAVRKYLGISEASPLVLSS
jgi:hypothetical protein